MTDPLRRKKREGWLGLALTVILCLGFLYWWFRPAREAWVPHTTGQLVERALAEPGLDQPQERLVLDFDLLETAILQARLAMVPESLETTALILDPIVQARTIRQLAQAHLNQDAKNLGAALTMCDRITDSLLRSRMKEEVLLQIAMMGFSDIALPEAKTPLLRAKLARRLAETDGQDTARLLLAEGEAALPAMPKEEAAQLLPELAWTHVHLAIYDGPEHAFAAIQRVPSPEQDELWLDLFRVCFGREGTAAADSKAVAARITAPGLRRQIELEALQSGIPLRSAEAILKELRTELKNAPPGAPQIRLLIQLADAQRRVATPEDAAIPLRSALDASNALRDPVERATFLAELAELLPDALMFVESKQALTDAAASARGIVAPDQRVPLLIVIMQHAFNAGEIQTAAALATEALELARKIKLSQPLATELADFLTRIGDWPAAVSLLPEVTDKPIPGSPGAEPHFLRTPDLPPGLAAPSPPPAPENAAKLTKTSPDYTAYFARAALLDTIAATAAESVIGYDPADPPNRGEPLDRIRNRAITDETAAASYLPGIPAGYQRARATLAIAKGLLLPPIPSASSGLPDDPGGPLDLLPGQEPPVPVMPEDPEQ